jgi:hypothetical protein
MSKPKNGTSTGPGLDGFPAAAEQADRGHRPRLATLSLENAARVEEARRDGGNGIYHFLFDDLEAAEQRWVADVLARKAAAEQAAEQAGQPPATV